MKTQMNSFKYWLQSLAMKRGYIIQRLGGMPAGNEINILKLLVDRLPVDGADFTIVQIGANDGKSRDPVYPFIMERGWSGVLVEPIPSMFEKLSNTYHNMPNIKLENCAIANADGTIKMYIVNQDDSLPEHVKELASLDRNVILRQKPTIPTIDRFIDTVDVPAKTISSLLTTYDIQHLNLLQVDTEGFDYEIIKMTFQASLQPDIINFESIHLSPEKKLECGHLLASKGYRYVTIERDTIAVKESLIS